MPVSSPPIMADEVDFRTALNPLVGYSERVAAWERYELRMWTKAHLRHGLRLRSLDEPMKTRVYEYMCELMAPRGGGVRVAIDHIETAQVARKVCTAYPCSLTVSPCAMGLPDCERCHVHCIHQRPPEGI